MNGECLLQKNLFSIPLCKTDMIDCMDYRIVVSQTEFCANASSAAYCMILSLKDLQSRVSREAVDSTDTLDADSKPAFDNV